MAQCPFEIAQRSEEPVNGVGFGWSWEPNCVMRAGPRA
jgi:hypothetical protein